MTYVHRVTDLSREDDIQIRLTDGTTMDAEYIASSDAFIWAANEEGQFAFPTSNIVWIRKDLKREDY